MKVLDPASDWQLLLRHLPSDFEQLAVDHKQLETQYGNAKIRTAADLMRLMFVHVGAELPLRQTVALVAAAGGPALAPMRLHMKMRRAEPYLRALVRRMCGGFDDAAPERWAGYEMMAVDASTVCGPGATGTDARLHTLIRLSDLSVRSAEVTDASGGETFKRFHFEPGQLVLADRGYCNGVGIASVLDDGADVLVRLNRGAMPLFDDAGKSFEVLDWARSIADDTAVERSVRVKTGTPANERWITGRLVAFRLDAEEAAKARRRVKRELGSDASEVTLEMASYVVLFTTVPKSRLSAARCLDAYRLRWQVELLFKRWKSLGGADRLPNTRPDTIVAWLYVKLLLGLIVERIGSAGAELSPPIHLAHVDWAASRRPPPRSPALEGGQHHLANPRRRDSSALAH
jgi:hypothetical protein